MTRPVLLSLEPWDQHWRRNQQLASRIAGTVFVEPPAPGLKWSWRREGEVQVLTPAKTMPFRVPGARDLYARRLARELRAALSGDELVVWATHAYHEPITRHLGGRVIYDRTDDWPEMETDAGARREVARRDRALIEGADCVVIVSEAMRAQTRPDAVLVPNGVDYELFSQPSSRAGGDRFRVGFAGTLDAFRVDFEILQSLSSEAGVELLLIGPGECNVPAVHVGPVPPAEVARLLLGCDALIAPYREDLVANKTADALKLYEYFATGLPVLATMTAGFERHRDLVVALPGADGILAASKDAAAHSSERQEIARKADWGVRSHDLARVLAPVATS